jgi:non-ribosomal peptide synthetase component F
VTTPATHRLVEQHAAIRASLPALLDGDRAVTYRELNYAANALARRLMTSGFRRGGHAIVSMPLGIDLAIVLLAILKAGGSYAWSHPAASSDVPAGVSFTVGASGQEIQYLHLDVASALDGPITSSPNLPIITRGTDAACVLPESGGSSVVVVPHSTITALRSRAVPQPSPWTGDPGAFDLWMALMAGTTAIVENQRAAAAA